MLWRPTIWITVGQEPIAPAVGAGGVGLDIFYSHLSFLLFLPLFGRRPDIDWNIISMGRYTQNNQPTYSGDHIAEDHIHTNVTV